VWEKRKREAEKLFERDALTSTPQKALDHLVVCSGDAQDTNNVAQDLGGRQIAFSLLIFLRNRPRTLTRLVWTRTIVGRKKDC